MFLVDTSIWIGYLRGIKEPPVVAFEQMLEHRYPFGITQAIYQEVLQGAGTDASFDRLAQYLGTQVFYEPRDPIETFTEAARIYYRCRRAGITVRSTIDCLIARIAIENDLLLVHDDRDFPFIASVIPELKLYAGNLREDRTVSYLHQPQAVYHVSRDPDTNDV
ncbi:MAG: PIN domain nuclease [Thermoanaerobaculia bacterium]|nr:PIN domain nuclease [Thermoanaerobaculia bacterium]